MSKGKFIGALLQKLFSIAILSVANGGNLSVMPTFSTFDLCVCLCVLRFFPL